MNRIKCLKCNQIIHSKHRHDYVTCLCGAVSVDGGNDYCRVRGAVYDYVHVDDEGKTIIREFDPEENGRIEEKVADKEPTIPRAELIEMLERMAQSIEKLPPGAAMAPITHADHYHLLLVLSAIFRAKD